MSPFQSLREYELFVYSLPDQFPRIVRSTLVVAQRGRYYAELAGEVLFPDGYRLNVYERLSWDAGPLTIEGYSYEVWRGSDDGVEAEGKRSGQLNGIFIICQWQSHGSRFISRSSTIWVSRRARINCISESDN